VGFGLQIATEPEIAKGLWTQMKSLTPSKVKKMLIGAGSDKLSKYAEGGNVMKHEVGKDGVQIAMMFFTGGAKKIKDGLEMMDDVAEGVGRKLDDFGEAISDGLGKNLSQDAREVTLKGIKDGDITKEVAEEINEELKDATTKANKSYIENFIKGKKYENRIDDKYIKSLDDVYYSEASSNFGISKDKLKGLAREDQLQINIDGDNYFVADNAFHETVKYIENGVEKTRIEVWINETKINIDTPPTPQQGKFLRAINAGTTSFTVRSLGKGIPPKSTIIIKSIIKTGGNGTVSDIYQIKKLF
jgi:hypothetical protein